MSTPFSLPVREQPLILATRNPGKVRELADALRRFGFDVRPLPDDFPEIEETGTTFEQNALLKAHAVADTLGLPALADDSGLEVDALNGAPGVYSARYAGDGHDSAANNAKLLREMENIPDERRAARFVCAICAVFGEVDIVRCEGACEGTIARRLHGQNGFGYDPLFMVGERSFAELDGPAKDAISHRGRALAALYEKLKDRKEGE